MTWLLLTGLMLWVASAFLMLLWIDYTTPTHILLRDVPWVLLRLLLSPITLPLSLLAYMLEDKSHD